MTASIDAVSLLVIEAADCLMAVPASEIALLEGSDPLFTKIENRAAAVSVATICFCCWIRRG